MPAPSVPRPGQVAAGGNRAQLHGNSQRAGGQRDAPRDAHRGRPQGRAPLGYVPLAHGHSSSRHSSSRLRSRSRSRRYRDEDRSGRYGGKSAASRGRSRSKSRRASANSAPSGSTAQLEITADPAIMAMLTPVQTLLQERNQARETNRESEMALQRERQAKSALQGELDLKKEELRAHEETTIDYHEMSIESREAEEKAKEKLRETQKRCTDLEEEHRRATRRLQRERDTERKERLHAQEQISELRSAAAAMAVAARTRPSTRGGGSSHAPTLRPIVQDYSSDVKIEEADTDEEAEEAEEAAATTEEAEESEIEEEEAVTALPAHSLGQAPSSSEDVPLDVAEPAAVVPVIEREAPPVNASDVPAVVHTNSVQPPVEEDSDSESSSMEEEIILPAPAMTSGPSRDAAGPEAPAEEDLPDFGESE